MKKSLSFLLSLTLIFSLITVVGCGNGGDGNTPPQPEYEEAYTYNDTYHWRNQINGEGYTDYAEHYDNRGKCECGYYYDATDFLEFRRLDPNEGLGDGYAVSKFLGADFGAYPNIEIPTFYQDVNDDEPLPVLGIDSHVFSADHSGNVFLESIKLNEGLKFIGARCFYGNAMIEVVIPHSVTRLGFSAFDGCYMLEKVIIGDGVQVINGYTFYGCEMLKEVVFGESVSEINHRAFGACTSLKSVVLPKSLVSIPEFSIYAAATKTHVQIWPGFENLDDIYFDITEEEYNALLVPQFERNFHGAVVIDGVVYNPDPAQVCPDCQEKNALPFTSWTRYGYVEGWCGNAKLHFKGSWSYDSNGKPVAN